MPNDSNRTRAARRNIKSARQHFAAGKLPDRRRGETLADAKRSYDRYIALARDAASAGDAIESENYYQHAEHYLRTMREHAEEATPAR